MPIVTIFSGKYCHREEIAGQIAARLGSALVSDQDVIAWGGEHLGANAQKLEETLNSKSTLVGRLTRDRHRHLAQLRESTANTVASANLVHHGLLGHLIPKSISHVLRVCLVATHGYRQQIAMSTDGLAERAAKKTIQDDDLRLTEWTKLLFEESPWEARLYDIKIPMHEKSVQEAISLIAEHAQSPVVAQTAESEEAVRDWVLASRVNSVLVENGFDVTVSARRGVITAEVNKYVMRMDHMQERLRELAVAVEGVKDLRAVEGPGFRTGYLIDSKEFSLPARVMLVDDEREFVQTLSERLRMRDFGTTTVHNGEEALAALETEEPEVMVLDLRMPGIDGIEVLRRVKETRPRVEVVILTGHGSERDRQLAEELGAFAYLEKPVDIAKLTETLQRAYQKVRTNQSTPG